MTYTYKCQQGHITKKDVPHVKPIEEIPCSQCEPTADSVFKPNAYILYYKEI